MDMENQRVALITGGASGLGKILVDEFVKEGYHVCFTYWKSKENANNLAEQYGDKVLAFHADATEYEKAFEVAETCINHFGRLDVLVNNPKAASIPARADGPP